MLTKFFFGFLLLIGIQAQATNYSPILTEQQQKLILDELNNICGDTWCEGEYNITFLTLEYQQLDNSEHYLIKFMAQASYMANQTAIFESCQIKNVNLIRNIVLSEDAVIRSESESEFYNQIDICLADKLFYQ